ncbi:long-chain fatty acid--CoA ligase [Blastococcus sp. MG754426]|uniref:acyl-CoA synthetase n=1 Tax=unclassified Blastococcus TaxID=2619396 RepID=UPI001EEF854F|nr:MULTISPECIES: long-chain fatty acid--CoA ligase [unclassified Blastococcus]MCF6506400.1 long-chain fatty acid--CoA ligase [Blastococcus sp. MG754426]MCF6513063.1 long-chain fatty acid--CoA ligase [Blastococcus sp. MG754427]
MDKGIGSWVATRAFLSGDRVALVEGERRLTYADLDGRTDQLARALRALGVRRGDRVAGLLLNSAAFLETMLATAKLGAVFVPMNVRLAPAEVSHLLADSGSDTFVYSAPLAPVARAALAADGVRVRSRLLVGGEGEDGELDYEQVLAGGEPRPVDSDVDRRDLSCLMYTSGTTGRPKGAMLTHDNHLWNVVNSLSFGRGLRESDVTVTVAPMFHIGGLGVHTLPLLYVGGTNVVLPSFDPIRTLEVMSRERATVQFMVPAMWAALMSVPGFDGYDLSSLELAVSGGAPCPLPVIDFFQGKGLPFQEGFGMTETAPLVSVLDADHVKEKAGSIGRAVFHVQARIVDDTDRNQPADEVGELVLRGPNVFAGYWGLPEATAEAFRGGWFHTGDLGRMDGEGFITLVDRKKDMIISGGENVYPIEVEQVLYRHDAIREVAVVGVPDDRWGETPVAVVALQDGAGTTAEELIAYARERLAHFKCPTRVEFVPELPRNATGKVLKTVLRQQHGGGEHAVRR